MLDLGERGEMVGVDEYVPTVLERCQQVQRLLEIKYDQPGRLVSWRFHTGERSVQRWDWSSWCRYRVSSRPRYVLKRFSKRSLSGMPLSAPLLRCPSKLAAVKPVTQQWHAS